jgi:hypothetical protein
MIADKKVVLKIARKAYRKHHVNRLTKEYVEKHGWKEDEARWTSERTFTARFCRDSIKTKSEAVIMMKSIGKSHLLEQ